MVGHVLYEWTWDVFCNKFNVFTGALSLLILCIEIIFIQTLDKEKLLVAG